jgi:hypothetical protein
VHTEVKRREQKVKEKEKKKNKKLAPGESRFDEDREKGGERHQ